MSARQSAGEISYSLATSAHSSSVTGAAQGCPDARCDLAQAVMTPCSSPIITSSPFIGTALSPGRRSTFARVQTRSSALLQ